MTRTLLFLAFAALPNVLMAQPQPAGLRGCPPPPTGQVAAMPDGAPLLAGVAAEISFIAPHEGWAMGRISWVATDSSGLIYVLQRGDQADPIVVVNHEGRVVRSWARACSTCPIVSGSTPEATCGRRMRTRRSSESSRPMADCY